jgi:hypothetical protein
MREEAGYKRTSQVGTKFFGQKGRPLDFLLEGHHLRENHPKHGETREDQETFRTKLTRSIEKLVVVTVPEALVQYGVEELAEGPEVTVENDTKVQAVR